MTAPLHPLSHRRVDTAHHLISPKTPLPHVAFVVLPTARDTGKLPWWGDDAHPTGLILASPRTACQAVAQAKSPGI